jgi:hypothetical protein
MEKRDFKSRTTEGYLAVFTLVAIACFIVGAVLAIACFAVGGPAHGFAFLAVALLPGFFVVRANLRFNDQDEAGLRQMAGLGKEDGYVFALFQKHSEGAIALNPDTKTMVLGNQRYRKVYRFGDLREWEFIDERPAEFVNSGLFKDYQTMAANSRARNRAKNHSGLYIRVKDIDDPQWRIGIPRNQHARWAEILRQVVTE